MQLTKEQVDILLSLLQSVSVPGAAIDQVYGTKQALIAIKQELAKEDEQS